MRTRLRHRSATSRSTTPSKAFYPALRGRITTAAVPSGAAAVCVNGGTPDFAWLCRKPAALLARHPANTSAFPCPPRPRQRQDGACGHSTGKSNPGSLWGFTATQWPLAAAQDQRGLLRASPAQVCEMRYRAIGGAGCRRQSRKKQQARWAGCSEEKFVVDPGRFELPTSALQRQRSTN